jgi:hypothetical protein
VILTVHEMKRLARNAAELMTVSAPVQVRISVPPWTARAAVVIRS